MKQCSTIIFLFALLSNIHAQQTGSFSMNIDFNEVDYMMSNELAFYVPLDYSPSETYPLIVGFRGGPHSGPGHFRDQLQPLSDSLDAIIMCPESVSLWQNSEEELVKQLFRYSVDTIASMYNVDMDRIYVTGLSFGGRHAVIVGMDTDAGPIYPGIRGLIPFAAGIDSENVPNYDQNPGTPLCTCVGQDDSNTFFNVSYTLHFNSTGSGWTTFFNDVQGVGHTTDFPTFIDEMMECVNFIEQQYTVGLEEVSELEFTVHPNPASDFIVLNDLPEAESIDIKVTDNMGALIYAELKVTSNRSIRIQTKEWRPGLYTIVLKSDQFTPASTKILIR